MASHQINKKHFNGEAYTSPLSVFRNVFRKEKIWLKKEIIMRCSA